MEMPQSGERIRGREKMREFQEAYPNPPAMRAGYPQGWSVGRGGRQGLRRGAGLPRRGHRGAARRRDVTGHPLLREAVRGARVAGAVGRADGTVGARLARILEDIRYRADVLRSADLRRQTKPHVASRLAADDTLGSSSSLSKMWEEPGRSLYTRRIESVTDNVYTLINHASRRRTTDHRAFGDEIQLPATSRRAHHPIREAEVEGC
jgi:hypothetical protein